jgi:hypothetical protein
MFSAVLIEDPPNLSTFIENKFKVLKVIFFNDMAI